MADQELIGIREFARRIGVSDTAVHKAIKAGRVTIAGRTEKSDRPLLSWPQAKADWERNSDSTKRTHVGGTGKSQRRAQYTAGDDSKPVLPTRAQVLGTEEPPPEAAHVGGDNLPGRAVQGPSLAQSKAIREAYMARLAKLEYEEKSGKLVSADEVKAQWFKLITAAKTRILGIPAACKSRIADLPLQVVATIDAVCREALEDLANGKD